MPTLSSTTSKNVFMSFGEIEANRLALAGKSSVFGSFGGLALASKASAIVPGSPVSLGARITTGVSNEARSLGNNPDTTIEVRRYGTNAPVNYAVAENGQSHLAAAASVRNIGRTMEIDTLDVEMEETSSFKLN